MVDDYIRYPVVKIVSTTSAASVTPRLNEIFLPCLAFQRSVGHNGPPFQGNEFATYARTHGSRHRKITSLHPEVNGKVERFVRTLQEFIMTVSAEGCVWRTVLPSLRRVTVRLHILWLGKVYTFWPLVEKCVAKLLSLARMLKRIWT